MNDKSIPLRIKELCEKKNTNVSTMEKDLEFSSGLVSRWDKTSPSADRVVLVAKYLDTSTDYLLGMSDEDNGKTLTDKFIEKLTTDTINMDLEWKQFEDGKKFRTVEEIFYDKYDWILSLSSKDIYYTIYNGTTICLYNNSLTPDEDEEYVLFIEFNFNNTKDKSNYSIISSDQKRLSIIYKYIVKYYNNIEVAIREKNFMESFLNRFEDKYEQNQIISNYYKFNQKDENVLNLTDPKVIERLFAYSGLLPLIPKKKK